MERVFAALSDKGTVTMAMHDAFWGGRFGMLTDRFGISWMLSYRTPGEHA
jgi:PhnB protein